MKIQQVFAAALFVLAFADARRSAPADVPKKAFGAPHTNPYAFGLGKPAPADEKAVKEVKAVKKPEKPAFVTRRHQIMQDVEAAMAGLE
ncbi:expressed unknown protein [Seminavis robusta]|uniref:Uncharacterized protein n=1 Tax=Seminavis robusta TaxID=568900 RepID=A0A9N8H838_9STRA|nr:expressed unknown protein [Seminavis robusta]|eukprot:Sro82_g043930.1 n/a (89) ;mRNA; r:81317-81685